jgi:hypothetical protein
MQEESTKIEKPWAVYSYGGGPSGIGLVVSEDSDATRIQYCEGQHYPAELWESRAVKRFDSSKEAMSYYLNTGSIFEKESHQELTHMLETFFPKAFRQEQLQILHNTLSAYITRRSQRKPKRALLPGEMEFVREVNAEIMNMPLDEVLTIKARVDAEVRE